MVNEQRAANGGRVLLTRGFATIPLTGIDVPFHSRFLLSGVGPFRAYLKSRLDNNIDLSLLEHQYIPNLTAVPFVVTKEYFDLVLDVTNSEELRAVAKEIGNFDTLSAKDKQKLGFALLVELLAFQFASPVQWIKTMDIILGDRNMERIVELGMYRVVSCFHHFVSLVPNVLLPYIFRPIADACGHVPAHTAAEIRRAR